MADGGDGFDGCIEVVQRTRGYAGHANRAVKLYVNIQDGDVMVRVDQSVVYVAPDTWKRAA